MSRSRSHGWFIFWSGLGAAVVTGCFGLINTYMTNWITTAGSPAAEQSAVSESAKPNDVAAQDGDNSQTAEQPPLEPKLDTSKLRNVGALLDRSKARADLKAKPLKKTPNLRSAVRSAESRRQ